MLQRDRSLRFFFAVTPRTLAECPALVDTAHDCSDREGLLLGMAADDAMPRRAQYYRQSTWVKPENVDAPVNPGGEMGSLRTALGRESTAVPTGYRLRKRP